MATLKNRQNQIPNGFKYRQAETGWTPPAWSSFETIVLAVMAHRRGNPALARKHKWALDHNTIAAEVDSYNAALCEAHGWTDFILPPPSEAPLPKFKALSSFSGKQLSVAATKSKQVWQGVKSLNDWIDSGESAVPTEQAENRAAICVACPLNGKGGLEEWFTKPASGIIQKQIEKLSDRKLSTTLDEKLGICKGCLCPLKLLVWTPLKYKLAHMGPETRKALDPSCWVTAEERAIQTV